MSFPLPSVPVRIAAFRRPAASEAGSAGVFTLQGSGAQSIDAGLESEATIKHEEIKGFMPAMTMPYKVKEAKLLDGIAPGDLINATACRHESNDAFLTGGDQEGRASAPPAEDARRCFTDAGAASWRRFELLKPGEAVPDERSSWTRTAGSRADFSGVQRMRRPSCNDVHLYDVSDADILSAARSEFRGRAEEAADGSVAGETQGRVQLVSVSFDPATDTPPVLKRATRRRLEADLARWTFLTGDRDDIDRFASRFGVQVARAANNPRDITHNLRTAIVGADGKLVKIYTGNEWTPEQILADLRAL